MPSKIRKQSKTTAQSKLSYSDMSPSPRTPLPPNTTTTTEETETVFMDALEEASRKYPSLITTSAFIGQVAAATVASVSSSKASTIWLSESSMLSSSLSPGSIVSVSLASPRKKFSDSFPLSSLADECSRNIGIDYEDIMANQAGNYFALATVFPSCKVLKNGVRLSSSLSYTMGCPAAGRFMFVNPIQSQPIASNGNGNDKPHSVAVNRLSLYDCKELYLELIPSRNGVTMIRNMSSSMRFSEETSDDRHRNQISSSPKTPLNQSKLSFPNTGQLTSSISENSVSSLLNPKRTSFDIREVLGDESSKKLLQTCATSWLSSRSLLYGNLVTIPILSEICLFQVIGANRLLADNSNQDWTGENSNFPGALKLVDNVDDAFFVDSETKVNLSLPLNLALEAPHGQSLPHLDFEDEDVKAKLGGDILKLGGLSKEYAILKDIIISSSVKDTLSSLGLRTTKGVLLHGPPGTGKTTLARLCAHEAGVNVFSVNGPEIVSQYYGESEKALHEVFDSASQAAPAVVFIDELDAIAPARKDGGEELSQRLVATLLNLMDGICRTDGILVIAATNRPDSIEPALRRPGRLDREIEIGVPSSKQRLDILLTLLSEMKHSLSDAQVQQLAMATHGFVGADLASLCNEAALVCLRHYVTLKKCCDDFPSTRTSIVYEDSSDGIKGGYDRSKDTAVRLSSNHSGLASSSKSDFPISSESLPSCNTGIVQESTDNIQNGLSNFVRETRVSGEDHMLIMTYEDFEKARIKVKPSAMREVILEVPKVNWEDVGGQKEVKAQLMEAVEWPQKHHDAFKRIGTRPPTGVLLFGPPGCSKTLMARAVASEAGLNFLAVKGPELFSKWVGESEKAVRSLFAKARANAPSIIFFDEIDGLAVIRGKESDGISVADRVMSQLLVELDGLHQRVNVTVIAATNRPDKIDPALLRPGRFDRLLYVGPPNESDRQDIFRIHLRKIPCSPDVSLKELASLTEGCTGADISLICREAAVAALEESLDVSEIRMKHLMTAIRQIQPSEIPSYHDLSARFQRLVFSSATTTRDGGSKCQPCSSRLSWIPFGSLMKYVPLFFHRIPAAPSQSKNSSVVS